MPAKSELNRQIVALQEKNDNLTSKLESLSTQLTDEKRRAEAQEGKLKAALEQAEDTKTKTENELGGEKTRCKQLSNEKDQLVKDLQTAKDNVASAAKRLEAKEDELKTRSDELYKVQAHYQEMQKDVGPKMRKAKELEEQLESERAQSKAVKSELSQAQTERQTLQAALQAEKEGRAADKSQADKNIQVEKASLVQAKERAAALERKLADAEAAAAKSAEAFSAQITKLEAELEDANAKAHGELEALAKAGEESMGGAENVTHVGYSEKLAKGLALKLLSLEDDLFNKSNEVVKQGEKNMQLSERLVNTKATMHTLNEDLTAGRTLLLQGIAGQEVDVSLYKHVSLSELIRLRLKGVAQAATGAAPATSGAPVSNAAAGSNNAQRSAGGGNSVNSSDVVEGSVSGVEGQLKLEQQMKQLRKRERTLVSKVEMLSNELEFARSAVNDVQVLKDKTHELAGRQRSEKDLRAKSEAATRQANEKVVALSEHIEKLMIHLKHEAAAKAKINDLQRRTEKEVALVRQRNALLTKKNSSLDRVISELKEGAKILEDQLRLMDAKYIDLRAKLDWTRASSQKEVKRVNAEANSLRAKWALAMDSSGNTGNTLPGATKTLGGSSSVSSLMHTPTDSKPGRMKPLKKKGGASSSKKKAGLGGGYGAGGGSMGGGALMQEQPVTGLPPAMASSSHLAAMMNNQKEESDDALPWSETKIASLQVQRR